MEAIAGKNISAPIVCDAESIKTVQGAVARLENKDMNAIEQTGYIHVILGTVLRYIPLENNAPQGDIDLATKIFLYINEHFKEKLSTEHIARELGYSPRYVAERFRTDFHIGISRYINTVRLKNALSLIRENKYTVTECAMESGFSSLRTFYRVFTEECGCSPKEYFKTE
jgi:AraC-like DNA-binding protein